MVAESQETHAHWFSRHMLLQSMISLKPKIQMKNCETPILANGNIFPMSYGQDSDMLYGVYGTCLKFQYVRSHCVQT